MWGVLHVVLVNFQEVECDEVPFITFPRRPGTTSNVAKQQYNNYHRVRHGELITLKTGRKMEIDGSKKHVN
jgi:hypothetical protein